jgi:GNAT superfamily N-acetyltransferase
MAPLEEFQVNFVVAVVIGVLSLCWGVTIRKVQRLRFQWKHRVAGAYLSYFEDLRDGQTVWVKAPLQVCQRGAEITADGLDQLKRRNTDTRAKVSPDGSIFGTYGRHNPNDPAKGVVFLEPDPVSAGLYRGFYAGYDSTLRRLVSGRYVWRRLLQPHIAPVTQDMPEQNVCRALLGDCLSSRYAVEVALDNAVAERDGKLLLAAWWQERVVGAILIDSRPEIDLSHLEHRSPAGERRANLAIHCTSTILALAVLEEVRNRGVATALIRAATEQVQRRNCTALVATVWRAKSGPQDPGIRDDVFTDLAPRGVDWEGASIVPDPAQQISLGDLAGRLFRSEGFRLLGRLVDEPTPPAGCSDCNPPCACEGWVYMKGLSSEKPQAKSVTTKTSTG